MGMRPYVWALPHYYVGMIETAHVADEALALLAEEPETRLSHYLPQRNAANGWPNWKASLSCERCTEEQHSALRRCAECNRRVCPGCTGTHYHKRTHCLDCI